MILFLTMTDSQAQTIHVPVTSTDLELIDAEAARMLEAAGGGRFSRAEVMRAVMRRALGAPVANGKKRK